MKKLYLGILFIVITLSSIAQKASLKGNVSDKITGETIVGASVIIEGTTIGAMTDFDGNFQINNIPSGTHTIICSFISYEPEKLEEISFKPGESKENNFLLGEAVVQVAEVNVIARVSRETEALLLMEQKEAEGIKESIGARRLSRLGVSDAAAATSKISGVTKNESTGDIYIRGLGDRYLTSTMNGLPIPSDDVEKKNIDLNLFSTDIIKNVGINKTYAVESYADQSSGAVDVGSKNYAENIELDFSTGSNTNIFQNGVFSNFRSSQNRSNTVLGSYRSPSSNLEDAIKNHSWNTVATKFPLNHDFSFLGGAKIKLFNKNLSIFGTLSNANSFNHHTGVYKNYRSNILNKSFTDAEKFSNTIITTGLLNIIYDINKNNNLSFNSLFINKMSDELYEQGRNGQGYFYDQEPQDTATFMRDQNLKNTLIFINQLIGSHKINDRNLLEWAVGFNMVNAGEPNRIRNKVIMLEEDNLYFVRQTYYEQSKSYQKIADLEINGYLKDKLDLIDSDEKKLKLIYGINFRLKSRSFTSLKRSVVSKARGNSIDNLDYVLLNSELYSNNSLIFQNSAKEDLYNSYLLAYAGYANAVFDLKKLSGSVGIRFESDLINSNWDVTNYLGREGDLKNNYYNVLPALNLKYNLSESNAIRIAASKTLTLPEFKELSPFEYVSPTGQVTKGNPDLKKSTNYNVDVKWELFPSLNELFSVSGFYKQINNPINRAQTRGSSGNFFFANTGEKANVYGLEIEARFDLIKSKETGQPSLNISMNASKMWFSQDLLEDFVYNYKTTTGLQGASGFISNASLRYSSNTEKKFTATLIGNYSSDKIYSLGAPESKHYSNELFNNEIIEKGFTTIDFVMSKKISDKISLKFSAKNLLNPSIEQTQEIEPQSGEAFTEVVRSYKKGISISLGLKINLK